MLDVFAVSNYRSLRDIVVPLMRLNAITGPNGSGKSSLYRALRLLIEIARDQAIGSLAHEGGLASVFWAGPENVSRRMRQGAVPVQGTVRKARSVLRVGFAGEGFGYSAELGLPPPERPPPPRPTRFGLDPELKRESIWSGVSWTARSALVERHNALVRARRADGDWSMIVQDLAPFDSMLTWSTDPRTTPEAVAIRQRMRSWRFYDHFRSDRDAPARRLQVGTRTPVLSHDGHDLVAALETILEIGDAQKLYEAIDGAFPGATIDVESVNGRLQLRFHERGLLRPLDQRELSEGTLRYLLWTAALNSPRPPELLVLNEPESSLHPDLLEPLAHQILFASTRSQVIVVTHSPGLLLALRDVDYNRIDLSKELGETVLSGAHSRAVRQNHWAWPRR